MSENGSPTVREQLESALRDLDAKEIEFATELAKAEAEFASNMTQCRAEFAAGMAAARADLRQALLNIG